ncbi:MAG: ribose 5-phosphate isomerase B [Bacteroidetes bacterium]|nr:ribose 5-phosphate isomerase B [Bacteroidota bacterium]
MKIAVASDHAGFEYKDLLITFLKQKGYTVDDLGPEKVIPEDDYPDYAARVSAAIQQGNYERGILLCGSGVGVSVAANKYKGICAAVCHDAYSAHQGVEHDNMNLLCLGARIIGTSLMCDLAEIFLKARFSNEERHIRRFNKMKHIEEENFR